LLIGESQIYVWIKTIESHSLSPQEQAQVWRDAVLNAGAPDNLSFVVLRYDAL
jgi:serine/threonine protein phosphatase PrpC